MNQKMDRGEVPSLLWAQSLFCKMGMVTLLSLQCCWGFCEIGYVSVLTLWFFIVTAAYYIIHHHILCIILYNITYYASYYTPPHIIHHIIQHHILCIILYNITCYTAHPLKNKNPKNPQLYLNQNKPCWDIVLWERGAWLYPSPGHQNLDFTVT